jgi:hypothetical protein
MVAKVDIYGLEEIFEKFRATCISYKLKTFYIRSSGTRL